MLDIVRKSRCITNFNTSSSLRCSNLFLIPIYHVFLWKAVSYVFKCKKSFKSPRTHNSRHFNYKSFSKTNNERWIMFNEYVWTLTLLSFFPNYENSKVINNVTNGKALILSSAEERIHILHPDRLSISFFTSWTNSLRHSSQARFICPVLPFLFTPSNPHHWEMISRAYNNCSWKSIIIRERLSKKAKL